MTEPSSTPDPPSHDASLPEELVRPPAPLTLKERVARVGDAVGVDLTPARVVGAMFAIGLVAALGFVVLRPTATPPPEISLPFADQAGGDGAGDDADAGPTATTTATVVLVHAAGAVVTPGVYQLAVGSRVADLVAAAGGAAADADLNRVNLAAAVEDGQQVYVPRVGETPPLVAEGEGGSAAAGGSAAGPIDINTAPVELLDELPGVGPAIAQAIVTYREDNGPFGSADDLLEVPGIGEAKLAQLRDLVTV